MAAKYAKNDHLQEDLQIEEAYRNIAGTPKAKKKSRVGKVLLVILLIVILIVGAFGGYLFFLDGIEIGKILNNTIVAGVEVGGMTKEEAIAAVEKNFKDNYAEPVNITLVNHTAELTAELTKVDLNIEDAVDIAYAYGRSGSYAQRKLDQLTAETTGIIAKIDECFMIDESAVRAELEKLAEHYSSKLTQTTYEIIGDMPSLNEPAVPESDTQDNLPAQPVQELRIIKGTPEYAFSIDAMIEQILNLYTNCQFSATASCEITLPDELDLDIIYAETKIDPVDAVMDPETFEVSEHSYGYEFDLNTAKSVFVQTLYGQECGVPFRLIEPQTKAETLRALLYRDVLGSYTAYTNSSWGRQTNLRLSCEAINGYIIYPNEIFSYNPVLGERTPDKGWEKADGYIGNKTVSEYGGGICQASSCLYLCAMLADLEIVERTNHGFISAYMPYGMDATVSWGGPEFRFKNTTEYPIKIEAIAEGGNVTVKLHGTDTKDYYVKMEYEVLEVYPFKTVEEEHAPDNKQGYKDGQVLITPYTGYKISTYRCKYDKQTDTLLSRDLEVTSNYASRDKVVCKIVDPNAATTPSETIPTDTTPPETTPADTTPTDTTLPETSVPAETQTDFGTVTEDG